MSLNSAAKLLQRGTLLRSNAHESGGTFVTVEDTYLSGAFGCAIFRELITRAVHERKRLCKFHVIIIACDQNSVTYAELLSSIVGQFSFEIIDAQCNAFSWLKNNSGSVGLRTKSLPGSICTLIQQKIEERLDICEDCVILLAIDSLSSLILHNSSKDTTYAFFRRLTGCAQCPVNVLVHYHQDTHDSSIRGCMDSLASMKFTVLSPKVGLCRDEGNTLNLRRCSGTLFMAYYEKFQLRYACTAGSDKFLTGVQHVKRIRAAHVDNNCSPEIEKLMKSIKGTIHSNVMTQGHNDCSSSEEEDET